MGSNTILNKLQSKNIFVEATCGGMGVCGKCTVHVDGKPCLACKTNYVEGMKIVVDHNADFAVLKNYENAENHEDIEGLINGTSFGVAIDIGTTTIAFALVDLDSKKVVFSHGVVNRQRAFGADVISRIKAAGDGKLDDLNRYIVEDINRGISYICEECKIKYEDVQKIVVAGNTTMLHILLKEDCRGLGQYPFTPVFTDMKRLSSSKILDFLNCEMVLLPGVSTYVGADVVAGLLHVKQKDDEIFLLVDLGTNGEIALFNKGKIICTATAAGPAFEAGNISCGVGSVPGAISSAIYKKDYFEYNTIGDKEPIGLCGSGVLDVTAQLLLHEVIEETGSLEDDITIVNDIVFTQKDVRELQLAKSAVRAGIEILLSDAGLCHHDVDKVYLAGGFGHTLNLESAIILGILPEEWKSKVYTMGNTCLAGCVECLLNKNNFELVSGLKANATEINLSAHPKFSDLFMEYMTFD